MDKIYDGALHDKYDRASEKPLVVNSCGLHKDRKLTVVREKGRQDYHLIYVKEGELYVEYEGGKYNVSKGGFVIYAPNQRQYYSSRESCERYWIHFAGTDVQRLLTEWGFSSGVYEADENRTVYEVFSELVHQRIIPSERSEIKSRTILQLLFMRLYEGYVNSPYVISEISALVQQINSNPASQIKVEEYIAKSGLGKDRFMHLFREGVGKPLHRYITETRLKEAKRLLKYSSLSISQISYSVGYDDPLYFSRLFKKYYYVSPKQVREKSK